MSSDHLQNVVKRDPEQNSGPQPPHHRRLLLFLIGAEISIAAFTFLAFLLPPLFDPRTVVLNAVLITTAIGFYLALQAMLRGSFSLMLFGLFSPALAATICSLRGLDVGSAELVKESLPAALLANFIVVLTWGVVESRALLLNRRHHDLRFVGRLSRFRILDLFILTALIAFSITAYQWLEHQPLDFWLIVYAQSVFMAIVALVTAFIVLRLSLQP